MEIVKLRLLLINKQIPKILSNTIKTEKIIIKIKEKKLKE